VLLVTLVLNYH